MKKNIFKTALIVAFTIAISTSCSDKFTEVEPSYAIDSENYFNSEQDYKNALISAYDMLQPSYINVMLGEIASDNTVSGGESANDTPGIQQIDNMNHGPVNANLKNLWDWMFAGVQRCNYILEFKDKTDFTGKNQIIAETRFLRAYYHFELVKFFGPIPLKGDKRFNVDDEKSYPRASVNEVYAEMESDLLFAIDNLSVNAPQVGRASKGAAQALLGKIYLYQNKFSQSAAVLDQLILSNHYSLVSNYNSIFENSNENNSESVFEVQYIDTQGADFGCLQCSEGNVAVGFNGIRNYSGPFFDGGYGFNLPTQEAYNAFEVGDSRKNVAVLDIAAWVLANPTASYGMGYKHTGYYNRKYLARQGDSNIGDQNLTNPNNYRSIRYADVLLMAAEAFNRTGNDAKAQIYLNLVRQRAFGDNNHNISVTGTALTDAILKERRVELMGEGHRFFDLVRTGKAASTITGFTINKNEIFPIPIQEIQFASGNWEQNPGY
ncbi:RagB/SusD family nutrient uptake outer membrane protein [Flavobacterium sp. SUN046]|uniref:RagB/SusD family nutrient uptake outer membrane protein n=1 Tax=Flavobacterium sp. SUN046 TaxID=3002440 RepID=UPI002DBA124F|nr:RagB/SusD family nutrient uptake outer membrane protein [Flavobacterium sp. SUN046]MEC4049172.1 RagB/SusD family nutrient uptake outer membrane protein [Flavobacterium sp. SUN046]